ncbi:MAG: hypothetical protein A2W03_06495 [Candidatus Aminicenantes bacterium RBG_16_63_16]|nr:MAG: hypothetical protein A2W03_06495 [Candidatus Aminicenantes bacterium RBG_16_63_16]
MFFRITAFILLAAYAFWLSYRRFQKSPAFNRTKAGRLSLDAYAVWAGRRLASIFASGGRPAFEAADRRLALIYPDRTLRWVVIGLAGSFAYLAASGLVFAVFTTRGMFGIPLLLHVVAGGLFAACLAAFAILRAKDNVSGPESFVIDRFTLRKFPRSLPPELLRPVLFWVFVAAGLALAVTALGSMVRFFSFDAQAGMIDVHRYSALAATVAAMGFFDSVFLAGDR